MPKLAPPLYFLLLLGCSKTPSGVESTNLSGLNGDLSSLDSDGDGLNDEEEQRLGTRPDLADTDADLINDGIEVKTLNTDPLKIDSNSDGIQDSIYSTEAKDLAIVTNTQDPLSLEVSNYYKDVRNIPENNIIKIAFDPSLTKLSKEAFALIKQSIDEQTPEHVQFYGLTWTNTYRVECISITSAITFGYNESLGSCEESCKPTRQNPYTAKKIYRPFSQLGIRPSMMISGTDFPNSKALIDRGVNADFSLPYQHHQAYLLQTSDSKRSVRKRFFNQVQEQFGNTISTHILPLDYIKDQENIMFYFTGLKTVPEIESNGFLPGAMADHLTSFGGMLNNSSHMSALRWLEAGATGSYGTVVEPCAYTEKFPNPTKAMEHYLNGATLIEAYWKSVEMPGQGVFIGEPLAKPYQNKM